MNGRQANERLELWEVEGVPLPACAISFEPAPGTLIAVYVQGWRMTPDRDYKIDGHTVMFLSGRMPNPPQIVAVHYWTLVGPSAEVWRTPA